MNKGIAGEPVYSKEFSSLRERLENRDTTKMIRREVVRHIQVLANQLK